MMKTDIVKVDKKTRNLILDILERDYNNRSDQRTNKLSSTAPSNKMVEKRKYATQNQNNIDPFDFDSDYDNMPMKVMRKDTGTNEEKEIYLAFYRYSQKSKKDMDEKLALTLLGFTKETENCLHQSDDGVEDTDDIN